MKDVFLYALLSSLRVVSWKSLVILRHRGEINITKNDMINGSDSWFQLQSREYRVDKVHGDIELRFACMYA